MFKRGLALVLVLGMASVVQAGVVLEAVPSPSGASDYNPCWSYGPGEVATVELFLTNDGAAVDLRMIHVRTDGTDGDLGLTGFAWGPAEFNAAHYKDEDLAGGPAGVSVAYKELAPDSIAQFTLGAGATESVGTLTITMPGTTGDYTLDLSSSKVSYGFELVPPADPITYVDVGDALTVHVIDQTLVGASPDHDESLWRFGVNCVRLTFDTGITVPAAGEVEIRELQAGGAFGADLSGSFTFAIDGGDPNTLVITETGQVLANKTWYTISSAGWGVVGPFKVHNVVQAGDATNDGMTLPNDLSVINLRVPTFGAGPCEREDISGDGNILFNDLSVANGYSPSFTVTKPTGHECE